MPYGLGTGITTDRADRKAERLADRARRPGRWPGAAARQVNIPLLDKAHSSKWEGGRVWRQPLGTNGRWCYA